MQPEADAPFHGRDAGQRLFILEAAGQRNLRPARDRIHDVGAAEVARVVPAVYEAHRCKRRQPIEGGPLAVPFGPRQRSELRVDKSDAVERTLHLVEDLFFECNVVVNPGVKAAYAAAEPVVLGPETEI